MSTNPALAEHDAHDDAEHHPSDMLYIKVGLLLGFLTAVEVATYFVDFQEAANPALYTLMIAKFAIVGLYFMHLKFDNKLLQQLFITGLVLALGVYFVVLFAFQFFD